MKLSDGAGDGALDPYCIGEGGGCGDAARPPKNDICNGGAGEGALMEYA